MIFSKSGRRPRPKMSFVLAGMLICLLAAAPLAAKNDVEKKVLPKTLGETLRTLSPEQRVEFDRIVERHLKRSSGDDTTREGGKYRLFAGIYQDLTKILTPAQLKALKKGSELQAAVVSEIDPAFSRCCYWPRWGTSHALTKLNSAVDAYYDAVYHQNTHHCDSTPYGIPDPILGSLDLAVSYATHAYNDLSAIFTRCGSSALKSAKANLEKSLLFSRNAIEITNLYCDPNAPWLNYVHSAINYIELALVGIQDCIGAERTGKAGKEKSAG